MKLAEALIERKALKERMAALQARAVSNIAVQEGEEADENSLDLLNEATLTAENLGKLIRSINHTNNVAKLEDSEMTITDAIVHRDMLNLKRNTWEQAVNHAQVRNSRYSRTEIKTVALVKVSELRNNVDAFSKEYRELDTRIQAANWIHDLIEVN